MHRSVAVTFGRIAQLPFLLAAWLLYSLRSRSLTLCMLICTLCRIPTFLWQSHIWAIGLRGYLNELDRSGEIVGHGDALPPAIAAEPPMRGAVRIERLQTGAAWLLSALEQRDRQLDVLQQQVQSLRQELAMRDAQAPTPGRPVGAREPIADHGQVGGVAITGESAGSKGSGAAASGSGGGALSELRIAPRRRSHVHVECPTDGARMARRSNGIEEDEEEERSEEDDGIAKGQSSGRAKGTNAAMAEANAAARRHCADDLRPAWSYMGLAEYNRFVMAVASRLKLAQGDSILDLAGSDCGSSANVIQQLYRGQLHVMTLLPTAAAAKQHAANVLAAASGGPPGSDASLQLRSAYARMPLPVNSCVTKFGHLGWIPPKAFDGAVTFGALSTLRSRKKLCHVFEEVLRSIHPGGRFIIADAEHPHHCSASRSGGRDRLRPGHAGGHGFKTYSSSDADVSDQSCGSCHWRVSAPVSFWSSCVPMTVSVSLTVVEHTDLSGASSHVCAPRHYALVAQRSSTQQQIAVTVEDGADSRGTAVLLSLAGGSPDGNWMRRVQHLKEASIDNSARHDTAFERCHRPPLE